MPLSMGRVNLIVLLENYDFGKGKPNSPISSKSSMPTTANWSKKSPYNMGAGGRGYRTQQVFGNDCAQRVKGWSLLFRTIDTDEYLLDWGW